MALKTDKIIIADSIKLGNNLIISKKQNIRKWNHTSYKIDS